MTLSENLLIFSFDGHGDQSLDCRTDSEGQRIRSTCDNLSCFLTLFQNSNATGYTILSTPVMRSEYLPNNVSNLPD